VSPTRTCAGCGRKAEQAELVRFVAREDILTPGRHMPGRGVYTCHDEACFERAREQHGFAQTLRRPVRVDPELARLYTGCR
jgi:predicted RNA-binding protein YlxR (DUF448 family)